MLLRHAKLRQLGKAVDQTFRNALAPASVAMSRAIK
jgi:hypothetical protein